MFNMYTSTKLELGCHSGFETQRKRHQKSKTGVSVTPKMDMCPKNFLKKRKTEKEGQTF